ncbi:hypothetical protein F8A90_08700 [Cobetia sp. cqz5-12]|nr:hypothetical protein F8A90_08700 [Cobetia sp. cqz5-12]
MLAGVVSVRAFALVHFPLSFPLPTSHFPLPTSHFPLPPYPLSLIPYPFRPHLQGYSFPMAPKTEKFRDYQVLLNKITG